MSTVEDKESRNVLISIDSLAKGYEVLETKRVADNTYELVLRRPASAKGRARPGGAAGNTRTAHKGSAPTPATPVASDLANPPAPSTPQPAPRTAAPPPPLAPTNDTDAWVFRLPTSVTTPAPVDSASSALATPHAPPATPSPLADSPTTPSASAPVVPDTTPPITTPPTTTPQPAAPPTPPQQRFAAPSTLPTPMATPAPPAPAAPVAPTDDDPAATRRGRFGRSKDAAPAAEEARPTEPEIKRPLFSLTKKSEQQKMARAARMVKKNVAPAPIRAPSLAAPRVEIDPKTGKPIATVPVAPTAPPPSRAFIDATKTTGRTRSGASDAGEEEITERETSEFQDHLVAANIVTAAQLDEAWVRHVRTNKHLFSCLETLGYVTEARIAAVASEFYSLPLLELSRQSIDASALDLVMESTAREYTCFPVVVSPEGMLVAVAEPSERLAGILTQMSGQTITMAICEASDIVRSIDSNYHALADVALLVEEFEAEDSTRRRPIASSAASAVDQAAEAAPIVQVVNRILSQAIRDGASDVHIEPSEDVVRVRNRVDGVLKVVLVLPFAMGLGLVSRIKIMAEMNIVERRRPQDGKFTSTIDGKDIDVRVATVATLWGETCVMRILDKSRSVLSINDLGMNPTTHETYSKMIRSPFGMVLCVGPTGSGKTTTLYASLSEINDVGRNIMTIEDPVEYVFPQINQIQTNEQAGLTFATGLKSILRQDSDIVLVGEIRDVETARIAVQSTLTGHFVLTSLHATDAVSALTRFIDMGIESFLIASSVIGLVGQRLVRRLCDGCKAPYTPSDEEMAFYRRAGGPKKDVFYHGVGCNLCGHSGFKDRIGVYELLVMTQEIKRLVVGFATEDELRDMARKQGMRTMQDEAVELIANDVTTSAEVVRSIYSF